MVEQVDARKRRIVRAEALKIVRAADDLYAAKGKKVVHLDLRGEKPSDAELAALVIGPSGNLRAPTLRLGKTLLVGFEPTLYERVFKT